MPSFASLLKPVPDDDILSYGKDLVKVVEEARKKGIQLPFVLYVAPPRRKQIYSTN